MFLDDWGSFLKLFGNNVQLEISLMSLPEEKAKNRLKIPFEFDGLDNFRAEHSKMLRNHAMEGNHGLEEVKLLTFGIEAENLKTAKIKLLHIEREILENLQLLKVPASPLKGKERLKIMHRMLHIGDSGQFLLDWKNMSNSKLSTKDYIAPVSFDFSDGKRIKLGNQYCSVSFVSIEASDLNDGVLKQRLQ